MKLVFSIFILLLFSVSSAENYFGPSTIEMEKTWIIQCPENDCEADFEGILTVNNSNQRVISITTEPEMNLTADEDGEIHAHYKGVVNERLELRATVTIEVDYDTEILDDSPLLREETTSTRLTEWNEDIGEKAGELVDDSSTLKTVMNMVEWVYDNVEYDISYFGQKKDAQTVFMERRGVCVEYSHLLISMLNSAGIKTRYVNGYVVSDDWQPHAWVEAYVPDYGWLPLDPVYSQIGILDNTHVMISYGHDQESDFDQLKSKSDSVYLDRLPTELRILSTKKDPKGLMVELSFNNKTRTAIADIENTRNGYVFALYSFYPPKGYGNSTSELVLLSPYETVKKSYKFENSLFPEGFSYNLPMTATVNDANDKMTAVVIAKESKAVSKDTCFPAFLLVFLVLSAIIKFADK